MIRIQAFIVFLRYCLNAIVAPLTSEDSESGQSLVEYALIMILIGVAAIVVMVVLGPAIGNMFENILVNVQEAAE